MIKWTMTKNGRPVIGLGLEAGNIELLMNGQPIHVRGDEVGSSVDIVIHYGATKEQMIEDMKEAGAVLPPEEKWQTPKAKDHK